MKKIFRFILAGAVALSAASACSNDFLKEEMVVTITQDYLDTEQGLDQLIVSNYNAFRYGIQYHEGFFMYEVGHDLIDGTSVAVNQYQPSVWEATGTVGSYVNTFLGVQSKNQSGFIIESYPIINCCNKAINTIRDGKALGRFATDPQFAAQRLSETLVCRAWIYYNLNTMLGDVFFSTQAFESLPSEYEFARTPASEMYSTLIGDLRYAVDHLPASYGTSEYGRATKYAVAHLLAKMYLNRYQGSKYGTSEYGRNADGTIDTSNEKSYLGMLYKGTGTADLDSAIFYSSMVIDAHPLNDDYSLMFKHELGDWSSELTSENVHNAVYAVGLDCYRYGSRINIFGATNYTSAWKGIPTWVWTYNTKPTTTYVPNDSGFDIFTDKINDSRFQKSFWIEYETAGSPVSTSTPGAKVDYFAYDDPSNKTVVWTEDQAAYFNANILPNYKRPSWGDRKAVAGEHKMGTNDISQAYIENTRETAIDIHELEAQPYVVYARWIKDGDKYYYRSPITPTGNNEISYNTNDFTQLEKLGTTGIPSNLKYDDPNRSGNSSEYAYRDVPLMRSAEMYLVRAEAYGRKGQYDKAIQDINVLRKRAAFKKGESRDDVIARLYPGHESLSAEEQVYPYTVAEDTYDKIKVDASYWDGTSENSKKENYQPQATTDEARFIEFICNEYAREFMFEMVYYGEVHHAGVQAARIQWHKQMAANTTNTTYKARTDWPVSDNISGTTGQTGQPKGYFQNFHTFRPFSANYMNLLTDSEGNKLTDQGKYAYQNYGYGF